MSFVRHFFRKTSTLVGVFLLGTLIFSGCQQTSSGLPSALATSKGLLAEAFLPQDSFVVFEFGANNQQQQDTFAKLLQHFPAEDQKTFGQNLVDGFDHDLTTVGLDYQKDIVPAIGNNLRVLVAIKGQPSQQKEPDVYAFVPLADPSKLDSVFDKLVQSGSFTKENYNSSAIFSRTNSNNPQFMARVDDMLIVTNSENNLKQALDRQHSAQPSLLQDQSYQKALQQLKPSLAFIYINVQGVFDVLRQDPTSRTQFEKAFGQLPGGSFVSALQGEMFSVQAEDQGLRLYGSVFGDGQKMKALSENFLTIPNHQPYLYKRVPGDSTIAYFEGYNLHQILNYDFEQLQNVDGFSDGLTAIKNSFSQIGLDFDKDVLTLFDEGTAFVFRNNGTIFSSMGFYTDVEKHFDEANKVMQKLNLILDGVLKNARASALKDTPDLVTNEAVDMNGSKVYVLRLHLDKAGSQNKNLAMLQLFLTKPLELWYGVTNDKLAFIAFEPNFDQIYSTSPKIADDKNFQQVVAQLPGLNSGLFYLSPATFVDYLDKIVGLSSMNSANSTQDQQNYQKMRAYLKAFTGFVFTTTPVSAGEAHIEGFIKVQ